jgi:hypothetical protein
VRNAHRWLLVVPFVWQAGLAPVVNGVRWRLAEIPFPMLWQMAGVVVATICIGTVYRIDRARSRRGGA